MTRFAFLYKHSALCDASINLINFEKKKKINYYEKQVTFFHVQC